MAEYDGDIKLSVALEPGEAIKSAKNLEKEIEHIFKATRGKDVSASFKSMENSLSSSYVKAQKLQLEMAKLGGQKIPTAEYTEIEKQISKTSASLNKLLERENELSEGGRNLSASYKKLADQRSKMESTGSTWDKSYQQVLQKMQEMEDSGEKYTTTWNGIQSKIAEARGTLASTKGELDYLVEKGKAFTLGSNTEQYKKMESDLAKVNNQMLVQKTRIEQSKEGTRLLADAARESGEVSNQEIAKLSNKLEELKAKQKELASQGQGLGYANYDKTVSEISQVESKLSEYEKGLKKTNTSQSKLGKFASAAGKALSVVGNAAKTAAVKVGNLAKKLFSVVKSGVGKAIGKVKDGFLGIGASAKNADNGLKTSLKTVLKYTLSIKSLYIAVRKLKGAIQEGLGNMVAYHKGATDIGRAITSLKNNLIYLKNAWASAFAPIISFVAPAINTAISALGKLATTIGAVFSMLTGKKTMLVAVQNAKGYGEQAKKNAKEQKKWNNELYGFDTLNKQQEKDKKDKDDSEFNPANNMFKEVATETQLPKWLADWTKKLKELWNNKEWTNVGKHIATLLNKGLKTLDGWINSTFRPWGVKWAGRMAKILNGLVLGLNWNLLGKTVADGFNSIADIINTFLKKFSFLNLGKGLGAAIKAWFDTADFKLYGETFANGYNALLHTIEGIVTTPGIWKSMGTKVGQFIKTFLNTFDINSLVTIIKSTINGARDAINAFLSQNPFKGIGEKYTKAINGIFDADFEGLASSVSHLIGSIFDEIYDIVSTFDFAGLGNTISGLINGLFDGVNLGKVGLGIATAVNGIVTTIKKAITGIDWNGIATQFANGINSIFAGIDWTDLGATIMEMANKLVGMVATFLGKTDWSSIGSSIGNLIQGAVTKIDWSAIGNLISNAAKGLLDALIGLFDGIDWATLGKSLLKGLFDMIVSIDWAGLIAKIFELLFKALKSALELLAGALIGLAEGLGKALVELFNWCVNAVKDFLGIHSPSTVFASIGEDLINGLLNGIKAVWSAITGFFKGAFSALKSMFSTAWNAIKNVTSTVFNAIKTVVTTYWNAIKTAISTVVSGIKTVITTYWNAIKTAVSTVVKAIKTVVTTYWNGVKTVVTTVATAIKRAVTNAWNAIKTGTSNAWKAIKTTVSNLFGGLVSMIKGKVKDFANIGKNIVDGLKNGITGAWDGLKKKVGDLFDGLKDGVKNIFKIHSPSLVFAEIGRFLDLGFIQGVDSEAGNVKKSVNDLMKDVSEQDASITPEIDADGLTLNLNNVLDRLSLIADRFQSISASIASMQNINIPPIATGKVIPAYAGATASNTNFTSDAMTNFADIISNSIKSAVGMNNSQQMANSGSSESRVISVNINGREIFNAVVEENNNQIRRTGKSGLIR